MCDAVETVMCLHILNLSPLNYNTNKTENYIQQKPFLPLIIVFLRDLNVVEVVRAQKVE